MDVTRLFLSGGLPVADIFEIAGDAGIIVQEDLGDTILRDLLNDPENHSRHRQLDEAISLIAQIQALTPKAFESGSIASRSRFDRDKLLWELNYFKEHYFETYLGSRLDEKDDRQISEEFEEIATELESLPMCSVIGIFTQQI